MDVRFLTGDIVTCGERIGVRSLLRATKGEVHYVENSACFCIQIPWIEYGNTDDGSKISWEMGHYSDIEVIGNIYENPELLKTGF
jgi:YopX protein